MISLDITMGEGRNGAGRRSRLLLLVLLLASSTTFQVHSYYIPVQEAAVGATKKVVKHYIIRGLQKVSKISRETSI